MKEGVRQVHPWEQELHPERIAIPVGNPKNVDLNELLNLADIASGEQKILWMMGMNTLILAPELVVGHHPNGKEKRVGHAAMVAGLRLGRIAGELGWDKEREVFFITGKSGRYCKGREGVITFAHLEQVAKEFGLCNLSVEPQVRLDKPLSAADGPRTTPEPPDVIGT